MSHETRVLLESAGDPFAESDEKRFLPRFPALRVLAGGGALLTLGLAGWLFASSAPQAEPKPALAKAQLAPPALPSPPPRPPAPAPSVAPEPALVAEPALPIGADLPDEDFPVSLPVGDAPLRTAHATKRAQPTRHARTASKPTNLAPAPVQSVALSSSPLPSRPIRQKVVRQLDF